MAAAELTDLFTTTQRVQRMLARKYFSSAKSGGASGVAQPADGSFNVAIQDGPQAGQTVPHVHVHVIPRPRGENGSDPAGVEAMDAVYKGMASEDGNVGGALWDAAKRDAMQQKGRIERPMPGGEFPDIEEAMRSSRSMEQMNAEADMFRRILKEMGE
jgi:diadenosine tetraphosphate (Ap4A) HIT family hydrolase